MQISGRKRRLNLLIKEPLYISGVVNDDLDFNYGSGFTLRGQMWYFGGREYKIKSAMVGIIVLTMLFSKMNRSEGFQKLI